MGGVGIILRTSDGGVTWTAQSSGTPNTLYGVFFVDADTGTVVGNGTILRTDDGGTTWRTQPSGGSYVLSAVSFVDADTGTAVGASGIIASGIILRTNTGGQ